MANKSALKAFLKILETGQDEGTSGHMFEFTSAELKWDERNAFRCAHDRCPFGPPVLLLPAPPYSALLNARPCTLVEVMVRHVNSQGG